jgi:hypothetical protein
MPKIERNNLGPYNEKALEIFKAILISNRSENKMQLVIPFRYAFFGQNNRPLPNFARANNLFSFIIYFIGKETNITVLTEIKSMANNYITIHNSLEKTLSMQQKSELLSETIKNQAEHIISIIDVKLGLNEQNASSTHFGPYAYLGYFPKKEQPIQEDICTKPDLRI